MALVTRTCAIAALLLVAAAARTQPPPPILTQPVNDFAKVIDDANERELERRINVLKNATGDILIVATVPTYQPYGDIKQYAVKMFENAGKGIGERAKDNGLLIVVAVEDRKVAIEVGYGLEPYITDGFSGQTIREAILPAFRQGKYGEGLVAGATRIINRIAEQRGVKLTDVPADERRDVSGSRDSGGNFPIGLVIVVIILLIMMAGRGGPRRRRRYWGGGPWSGWNSGVGPFGGSSGGFGGGFGGFGGGGGGGGFGGFGGGRSGGGGATGGW
jgi:uncharacterized protein